MRKTDLPSVILVQTFLGMSWKEVNVLACLHQGPMLLRGVTGFIIYARMVKKYTNGNQIASRPQGRPNIRWEDDLMSDTKDLKITNWRACALDRKKWRNTVEKVKTSMKL